jgi:hypothetical protein
MKKWRIGDRMEIKGYDAWLLFECTDDYDDDMPEDYEEDFGEPEELYEDYKRLDYIGG